MFRSCSLWWVLFGAMVLAGCGEDESAVDEIPPVRPVWVERSADDALPQRGIRAEPVPNDAQYWVRLEWYANPEGDISGYRIYRADERGDPLRYYFLVDLRVGVDLEPGLAVYSWVDRGDSTDGVPLNLLAPDPESGFSRGYYWQLLAYDTSGNRSARSAPVYYRLIHNPFNVSAGRDSVNLYSLNWSYDLGPDVLLSYYMIRVYLQSGGPDSVIWYLRTQRYESRETVVMDFSQSQGPLRYGQTYVCQLNAIANRPTVSHADSLAGAAVYTTFVYQN